MVAPAALEKTMKPTFSIRILRIFLLALGFIIPVCLPHSVAANTRAVVIAGLGGNVEYNSAFDEYSESIATALRSVSSAPEHVTYLVGPDANRSEFLNTLDSVSEEIKSLSDGSDAIDAFVLVMIGHGNMNRDGWQFNVAGPDVSVGDLIAALAPIEVANQVVVASTSASGGLLKPLTQPGRTVITATKSGGEINAVRFTEYFAESMNSAAADVDRNELLTVSEAFRFANDATQKYYEEQKLLASEHARLAGEDSVNYTLATLGALREAKDNPAVAALLEERSVLEKSFYEVKVSKPELSDEVYYQQLESVLLKIARLQKIIDATITNGEWAQ